MLSDAFGVLAAQTPDKPDLPSTSVSSTNVIIDWTAPNDNGSPIIGYKIYIRTSDPSVFEIDSQNCDGSLQSIVDAK